MKPSSRMIRQTVLAAAIATTLGSVAISERASAANLNFNLSGWLTIMNPDGLTALVNGDASAQEFYGRRTAVTGTMTLDTNTNNGTLNLQPFSFFGSGIATATAITFQDVDGPGGASTLMLGNMGFNWSGTLGIPVSVVWDGEGILDAINEGLSVGDTIGATGTDFACDTNISCSTPATDDFLFSFGKSSYTLPIGPSPVATMTWNTTDVGTPGIGSNPSGTLPLIADTVGGSPMKAGPFPGFNANFDFDNMVLTSIGTQESVNIDIPGGSTQECTATGSSDILMSAQITVYDDDAVDTIAWSLDGAPVASGESVIVPVPLGGHVIEVNVTTVSGSTFLNTTGVTVEDTIAPVINAAFIDSKTANEITIINSKEKAKVSFSAIDACDVSPVTTATAGLAVLDGDKVSAQVSRKDSGVELSVKANTDTIEVMVMAEDASGNKSYAKISLMVIK